MKLRNRSPLADRLADKSLLWFLCAALLSCASSKSSESSFEGSSKAVFSGSVTERLEEGPVRVVETVEEFSAGDGSNVALGPDAHPLATGVAPAGPTTGQLTRRTVTVTDRSPTTKTTETKSEAHQEGSVQAESAKQSASKPSLGFLVWPWVLGAAGAALAAFLLWKFRPSWLKAVLGIFGA